MAIFSNFPLLILFIVIWFITLVLSLIDESSNERSYVFMGISIAFIFLIIGYSNVGVTCVDCACETEEVYNESGQEYYNVTSCDTVVGDTVIIPHIKTALAFSGIFIIQVVLFIWLILRKNLETFYKKGKY